MVVSRVLLLVVTGCITQIVLVCLQFAKFPFVVNVVTESSAFRHFPSLTVGLKLETVVAVLRKRYGVNEEFPMEPEREKLMEEGKSLILRNVSFIEVSIRNITESLNPQGAEVPEIRLSNYWVFLTFTHPLHLMNTVRDTMVMVYIYHINEFRYPHMCFFFHQTGIPQLDESQCQPNEDMRVSFQLEISYFRQIFQLLPSPFHTDCINYRMETKFNSREHCVENCVQTQLARKCQVSEQMILLPLSLRGRNQALQPCYEAEVLRRCNKECPHPNCLSESYITGTYRRVEIESEESQLVAIHGVTTEQNLYKLEPLWLWRDFFLYIGSTLGFWFGFSLLLVIQLQSGHIVRFIPRLQSMHYPSICNFLLVFFTIYSMAVMVASHLKRETIMSILTTSPIDDHLPGITIVLPLSSVVNQTNYCHDRQKVCSHSLRDDLYKTPFAYKHLYKHLKQPFPGLNCTLKTAQTSMPCSEITSIQTTIYEDALRHTFFWRPSHLYKHPNFTFKQDPHNLIEIQLHQNMKAMLVGVVLHNPTQFPTYELGTTYVDIDFNTVAEIRYTKVEKIWKESGKFKQSTTNCLEECFYDRSIRKCGLPPRWFYYRLLENEVQKGEANPSKCPNAVETYIQCKEKCRYRTGKTLQYPITNRMNYSASNESYFRINIMLRAEDFSIALEEKLKFSVHDLLTFLVGLVTVTFGVGISSVLKTLMSALNMLFSNFYSQGSNSKVKLVIQKYLCSSKSLQTVCSVGFAIGILRIFIEYFKYEYNTSVVLTSTEEHVLPTMAIYIPTEYVIPNISKKLVDGNSCKSLVEAAMNAKIVKPLDGLSKEMDIRVGFHHILYKTKPEIKTLTKYFFRRAAVARIHLPATYRYTLAAVPSNIIPSLLPSGPIENIITGQKKLFTYVVESLKSLPPPYSTSCKDFKNDNFSGRYECYRDCVKQESLQLCGFYWDTTCDIVITESCRMAPEKSCGRRCFHRLCLSVDYKLKFLRSTKEDINGSIYDEVWLVNSLFPSAVVYEVTEKYTLLDIFVQVSNVVGLWFATSAYYLLCQFSSWCKEGYERKIARTRVGPRIAWA